MKRCKYHKRWVRIRYESDGLSLGKAWVECDLCHRKVRGFKVTVGGTHEFPTVTAEVKTR